MHGNKHQYERLEEVLSTFRVGDVASDHMAELEGFRGWNWIAITAAAKQATRALVYVYDDSQSPGAPIERKSLRQHYGSTWRNHAVAKGLVREHQGKVLTSDHPLVGLSNRPNPKQSGGSFRWEQMLQLRLHGSCLVFNRPNMMETRTVERYVIPLAMVTPIRPGMYASMPRGGVIIRPQSWVSYFSSAPASAEGLYNTLQQFLNTPLPLERMTITKYPHPMLKGDGSSPTTAGADFIDASASIDENRRRYYNEGPSGRMLLTTNPEDGQQLTSEQLDEMEDRVNRNFKRDGKVATFIQGAHSLLANRTADEMQYAEGHEQMRDAILATQGMSKATIGIEDGMTYGSLAASLKGASALSVQPDLDLLADQDSITIGREYGPHIAIELEAHSIDDPELEDKRLDQDSKLGVMTVGEYRLKRGEPLFGTEYDNFVLTTNGPIDPRTFIKTQQRAASEPIRITTTQQSVSDQAQVAGESKRFRVGVDPMLFDTLDTKLIKSLKMQSIELKSWDEDDGEVDATWDFSKGETFEDFVETLDRDVQGLFDQIVNKQQKHEFACVMLLLPERQCELMCEIAESIPASIIRESGGIEDPHVTLLYGITGSSREDIIQVVKRLEAPLVTFGATSAFPSGEHGIPLHVVVDGEQLHALHLKCGDMLPHVKTHPKYNPHATIAYVTDAERFIGERNSLTGKSCYLTKAKVSMEDGTEVIVPLRRSSQVDREVLSPVGMRESLLESVTAR